MAVSSIRDFISSFSPCLPQIYAYTTPEVPKNDGWVKIGYTEQQVEERIKQQSRTIDVEVHLEWNADAKYERSSETFKDTAFHNYLEKIGYERREHYASESSTKSRPEWFKIEPRTAKYELFEFRDNRGIISEDERFAPQSYKLREEQERAVEMTLAYARQHGVVIEPSGSSRQHGSKGVPQLYTPVEFLWNAKPRFGKTLAAYEFCKRLGAKKVLIVTNRPAIANSWYQDYEKFLGVQSGYRFVSEVKGLTEKNVAPLCLSREEYKKLLRDAAQKESRNLIEFVSLQDMKGSIELGGKYAKLEHIASLAWDVLIVDEAHEGVDTYKTDVAFDSINRRFTLHLSGTPFKALAQDKFASDAIFNWTYADEQEAKRSWPEDAGTNPYEDLPQLNMLSYKMSDLVLDTVAAGTVVDGEETEWAFDLNEFFETSREGYFVHNSEVDTFLDALTSNKKFPFSTPELRDELKHTFWLLHKVDSAKALVKKLRKHPVFKDYEIVNVAGDGKTQEEDVALSDAYSEVTKAIATHDKTITISCGRLTTGVTVPPWTAVLMLSNAKSPAQYMQAAFRAQNPYLAYDEDQKIYLRKHNAYVFDFDPARTLSIYEQFANDLCAPRGTAASSPAHSNDAAERMERVRELLNFFPVLAEDEDGEMVELDAEKVMSLPRKIHAHEVVRHGFMSNFLFQNIGRVYANPGGLLDIIERLPAQKEQNKNLGITEDTKHDLCLDSEGVVAVPDALISHMKEKLFGEKKYEDTTRVEEAVAHTRKELDKRESIKGKEVEKLFDTLTAELSKKQAEAFKDTVEHEYKKDLKQAAINRAKKTVEQEVKKELTKLKQELTIAANKTEASRKKELEQADTKAEEVAINKKYDVQLKDIIATTAAKVEDGWTRISDTATTKGVKQVETEKREAKKRATDQGIRDHLRGFSRTIPSFLMAYGDEDTTLATIDEIIPAEVFEEVTSITLDEFRLLRDGCEFVDEATGERVAAGSGFFDEVVFNDAVREFIELRTKLANYFDESLNEDIFDYIPPQESNRVFTPRRVVKHMLDLFEAENPGCFDNPDHTFADLYMKSGLYIAEIIKRLYASEHMQELYPDESERLAHILENQVFGMAPTQCIYDIATHYILGPNNEFGEGITPNFALADAAELSKTGRLAEAVEKHFGTKLA